MKSWLSLALAVALAGPAAAQTKAGDLTISGAVIRATAPGVPNTAGYMTIANAGSADDTLLSASCACAARIEMHLSHVMDGKAMMMPSGPVLAPARRTVSFAPGGYHLMIMGVKGGLKDGSTQTVTLKFQKAGTVAVPFKVQAKIGR